jgi:hypothetical protein
MKNDAQMEAEGMAPEYQTVSSLEWFTILGEYGPFQGLNGRETQG